MRILHISTRMILGGSQENTVLSCEGQARLGHEVHLAFGPIYGPEGSLLARVEAFNERVAKGLEASADPRKPVRAIGTHVVPNLVREVSIGKDRAAKRELADLIARLRPDVVHTHSSKAGILGRIAAWNASPRPGVVHTIHGPPFMPVEGRGLARLRIGVNNWIYTLAERHAAERCHSIVSVADAMTREFLDRGIGKPHQFETIRSGMEVEPFLTPTPGETRDEVRALLGFSPSDFVVGTVARLAQHKGHDDLLDALAEELRERQGREGERVEHARDARATRIGSEGEEDASRVGRWKLLWVGDGWWRERLVARARSMGLSVREADRGEGPGDASVVVTGLVPPERIPGLVRAMDVLAHPSSREGLPRTVPQALLAGVCPVAYDVDGTGEACHEMKTGRLVPMGGVEKLGEAIRWCAENPAGRAALAARGREMCRVAFSAVRMVSELERVYQKAVHRGFD